MAGIEQDITTHMAGFIAMLDNAFRRFGVAAGLPPRLRAAVQAVPRHRFVHRFRIDDGPLVNFEDDPARHMPTIYSDKIMRHVDAAGELLASSNSQPSFVLFLLHLLDIQPGHRMLEVGSGSGWLAAIAAYLAGPDGAVTGIEIIADLAEQSRADLASVGSGTVTIVTGDGAKGHAASAPFDRAMITAATWDLPAVLFEQVKQDGTVLVPIELRGGVDCQVTVLRRGGSHFVAERSVVGWFVPLVGSSQSRAGAHRMLGSLPFWPEISASPTVRCKLPLGAFPGSAAGPVAAQFRAFLGRTEPAFAVFGQHVTWKQQARMSVESRSWQSVESFGLCDEATRSVALCTAGELLGYGEPATARRLARAYARWAEFGLPGMAAFDLEVVRKAEIPVAEKNVWVEPRGDTALVWRLPADSEPWRSLLRDGAGDQPDSQSKP
ncbi:protein-L-isoaspartate O-methyltransferase family protein [Rhodopila sp.]|uniref:protein-L-isoaspartate O-methyltransferase family protein n=1 Tax=Rhodopila sp. TaxID=2480087 RepID=UPI003D0DA18D